MAGRTWVPRVVLLVAVAVVGAALGVVGTQPSAGMTGSAPDHSEVVLILFHGDGCPHCATEIDYLFGELARAYPNLEIRTYEVWADEDNRATMVRAGEVYGFQPGPVPVTIVDGPAGVDVLIGFGASTGAQIETMVGAQMAARAPADPVETSDESLPGLVDVPIVGEVDLTGSSALLATVVIGLVDGINPCSLWVLSLLIAMVLHSGSRRRVLLVGSVFLAVTAAMYAVYLAGLYSALSILDSLTWLRVGVALVAGIVGSLQLKDGLLPGRGPSLSISAARRPGLLRRMRGVSGQERAVLPALAATAVLAVGVSLLETPCTAGLPLLWANLLADQGVPRAGMVGLLGVYLAVFLVDELIVFVVAVVTLRSLKLQQQHGQALKIVAGSMLVTLAGAMLVTPEAMQSVSGTLVVFGLAAVVAGALVLGMRRTGQARRQRVKSVPSSERATELNDMPTAGSAAGPSAMRLAPPAVSTGAMVKHSSSSRRPATRSPSSVGPPSHSRRRSP